MNYYGWDTEYLDFQQSTKSMLSRERGGVMSVLDFKAAQKWAKLPRNIQELIVNNVFCSACGVTTIIKYSLHDDGIYGFLLKGKCKKCGLNVARLVEDE